MTREAEQQILKDTMINLVYHTCALRHTYAAGVLKAVDGGVYFESENKINPITFIPYEDQDGNAIDMRIRKRLAIEFINAYPLEFLHAEADNAVALENAKNEKLRCQYNFLGTILDQFNMFDSAEVKAYSNYPCIKLDASWKDYDYRYRTTNKSYELLITENGYRVQEEYNRLNGVNLETLEDVISYCNSLINDIAKLKAEAAARLQAQSAEEERQNRINTLCWNMAKDKNNAYIVKAKSTYTVYRGGVRYSMKGEGKFYNADYSKLENDMISGKITHYLKVDADFKRSDINLKEVQFIAI